MVRLTDRHSRITYSLASSRAVSSVVQRLVYTDTPLIFSLYPELIACAQR